MCLGQYSTRDEISSALRRGTSGFWYAQCRVAPFAGPIQSSKLAFIRTQHPPRGRQHTNWGHWCKLGRAGMAGLESRQYSSARPNHESNCFTTYQVAASTGNRDSNRRPPSRQWKIRPETLSGYELVIDIHVGLKCTLNTERPPRCICTSNR
jgi:hypothetical protein